MKNVAKRVFFAKIGADTAENEQHFAENLPKLGNYRYYPPLFIRNYCGGSGAVLERDRLPVGEPDPVRRGSARQHQYITKSLLDAIKIHKNRLGYSRERVLRSLLQGPRALQIQCLDYFFDSLVHEKKFTK